MLFLVRLLERKKHYREIYIYIYWLSYSWSGIILEAVQAPLLRQSGNSQGGSPPPGLVMVTCSADQLLVSVLVEAVTRMKADVASEAEELHDPSASVLGAVHASTIRCTWLQDMALRNHWD